MSKNEKLMKVATTIILVVQILIAVRFFYSLFMQYAGHTWIYKVIPEGGIKDFFRSARYSRQDIITFKEILYSLISQVNSVITFFILQQVRMIFKDMSNGLKFRLIQVKRVYAISLLLIMSGLWQIMLPFIYNGGIQSISGVFTVLSINWLPSSLYIGLIVFVLAKIFSHGVEVQTDSDLTV